MHNYIAWHFANPSPNRKRWLAELVGEEIAAPMQSRELSVEEVREAVLAMLKSELGFTYACHSPIEMVGKRRLHFSMIYGTSAAPGVFELRAAEKKTLPEHEWTVLDRRSPGQLSMFDGEDHSPGPYGALRRRHLDDLPRLVAELARHTRDAPRTFDSFAATVMEKHYVSPTEIKKQIAELAKQRLIEPTWKTRNEKAWRPRDKDLIVWIADKIT